MFRDTVARGSTPLNDTIANDYFKNVTGDQINGDDSFLVVLRALIAPRMGDEDTIKFNFTSSSYTKESLADHPIEGIIDPGQIRQNTVRLHAFSRSGSPEDNLAYVEAADELFSKAKAWEKLTRPTEYFARSMKLLVYVDPKKKRVALIVDSVNMQKIHMLEAGMLSFFPWYFDISKGYTANEKKLCESLIKTSSDEFYEAASAISDEMNFRMEYQIKAINELETRFDRETMAQTRSRIEEIQNQIERMHRQISDQMAEQYDLQIKVIGIEAKIASGACGELGDYFMSNKSLKFLGADDGIRFAAVGYMSYWDEDLAKRCIDNLSSSLYEGVSSDSAIKKEDLRNFYRAVFIDQTIKWRTCAAFNLRPGRTLERPHPYSFGKEFGTYMPNTHIDRYGCIGSYDNIIDDAITQHDYITALEQCVAAAMSFNFADGTVSGTFSKVICRGGYDGYSPNRKGFELPDGTVTDPAGAIKWIKEHKEG